MAYRLTTNRAFILKVRNFCKYYPLISKDPEQMIKDSIKQLKSLIERSKDTSKLTPLSSTASQMIKHSKLDELFQFQVIGEDKRFIIYRPYMFFEATREELELYDLLYIS